MAIHQVVKQDDDRKVLVEVPVSGGGCFLATSETPGVVQPDNATTKVDSSGILSALGGNLRLNDEVWITESGEWTAPVTGWYEALLIGGGAGFYIDWDSTGGNWYMASGGYSGSYISKLVFLEKNQNISVVIGAAGQDIVYDSAAADAYHPNVDLLRGGDTYFGAYKAVGGVFLNDIHTMEWRGLPGVTVWPMRINAGQFLMCHAAGGGFGGGLASVGENSTTGFYGCGATVTSHGDSDNLPETIASSPAKPGAVRLRFWNPAKAAGPAGE